MKPGSVVVFILLVAASTALTQPVSWTRISSIGYPGVYVSELPRSMAQRITDDGLFVAGMMASEFGGEYIHPWLASYDINFNLEWARIYDPIQFDVRKVFALSWDGAEIIGTRTVDDVEYPVHLRVDEYGSIITGGVLPHEPGDILLDVDQMYDDGVVLLYSRTPTCQAIVRVGPDGAMMWDRDIAPPLGGPFGGGAIETLGMAVHVFSDDDGAPMLSLMAANGDGEFGCVYPEAPSFTVVDGCWVDMTAGFWMAGFDSSHRPMLIRFTEGYYFGYAVTWPDMGGGRAATISVASDVGFYVTGISDGLSWMKKYNHDCDEEWTHWGEIEDYYLDAMEPITEGWTALGCRDSGGQGDVLFCVNGVIPEIEPPAIELWLYQPWENGFSLPAWGGPFPFQSLIRNNGVFPVSLYAWADLVSSCGNVVPLGLWTQLVPPGEMLQNHTMTIPPAVGSGNHALVVYLGIQPDDPIAQGSVVFRKRAIPTPASDWNPEDPFGIESLRKGVTAAGRISRGEGVDPAPPGTVRLAPAGPNPFNASTVVTLTLTRTAAVRVALVDVLGREARLLAEGALSAGEHRLTVDGRNLAGGIYFVVAENPGSRRVLKLALLK